MQTCMHICIIHGQLKCALGQDFPCVDPCSEKFEVGACLAFMEWCKFHLLRAFLGFADTTSCKMMWVGGNIFFFWIPWIGWILMSKRWNNVNAYINSFQSTADVANNTILFSKLLSPTSCNMMWVGGYKFWDEHNAATLSHFLSFENQTIQFISEWCQQT